MFNYFPLRLSRIRQRSEFNRKEISNANGTNVMSLFEDFAFLDKTNGNYLVGRVEKIILNGDHGKKDYLRPVQLKSEKKDKFEVIVCKYRKVVYQDGEFHFDYLKTELITVKFKEALSPVNLTLDGDKLLLSKDEHKVIKIAVKIFLKMSPGEEIRENTMKQLLHLILMIMTHLMELYGLLLNQKVLKQTIEGQDGREQSLSQTFHKLNRIHVN